MSPREHVCVGTFTVGQPVRNRNPTCVPVTPDRNRSVRVFSPDASGTPVPEDPRTYRSGESVLLKNGEFLPVWTPVGLMSRVPTRGERVQIPFVTLVNTFPGSSGPGLIDSEERAGPTGPGSRRSPATSRRPSWTAGLCPGSVTSVRSPCSCCRNSFRTSHTSSTSSHCS